MSAPRLARGASLLCAATLLLLAGCAPSYGSTRSNDAAVRRAGSLAEDHARARDRAPEERSPVVVGVGGTFLSGVDAESGKELWRVPVTPSAHVFSEGNTVYVPCHGNRLLAVERKTGEWMWDAYLPGEIIGGSASATLASVTLSMDLEGETYAVAGVGALSGNVRWVRGTAQRVGRPVVLHRHVVVPTSEGFASYTATRGKRVLRKDLRGGVRELEPREFGVVARTDTAWYDLVSGAVMAPPVGDEHIGSPPKRLDLDMGYSEQDGRRWYVESDGQTGFLLAHRAVLRVRLGDEGGAVGVDWVQMADPGSEFVALERDGDNLRLVTLRGQLVDLDAATGDVRSVMGSPWGKPLLSADFGHPFVLRGELPENASSRSERYRAVEKLVRVDDPRLLHAQLVALDAAVNDEAERDIVRRLADSGMRGGRSYASVVLRERARELLEGETVDASVLASAMSFTAERQRGYARAALHARRFGNKAAVPDIVARLADPRTPAGELSGLVEALCGFDADATTAVAGFARMYHADPLTSLESDAVEAAVDCLREVSASAGPGAAEAERTLSLIAEDPLTDRRLHAHMRSTRVAEEAEDATELD